MNELLWFGVGLWGVVGVFSFIDAAIHFPISFSFWGRWLLYWHCLFLSGITLGAFFAAMVWATRNSDNPLEWPWQ